MFENNRGGVVAVRIARHGKELVLAWDFWVRSRVNEKLVLRFLVISFLVSTGLSIFGLEPSMESLGLIFVRIPVIALPLFFFLLFVALIGKVLIKPVTMFDRDDNVSMMQAVHKLLIRAAVSAGIDQDLLQLKEDYNGGLEKKKNAGFRLF